MNCHSVQFFGNLPRLFTFRANRLIIIRMNDLTQKSSNRLTREQEREASRYFGRHVTPVKAAVSLCFALLTAASPMLLGLHLWKQIPEIVETGLTAINGEDDSIPRAVLVFGLPGLMCVLTLISHGQLWLHQKAERLPPTPIRITGRWSIPVISVLLCSFWLARAAGEATEFSSFLPCLLALLLILLGAHFFDCPRDSQIAFRFPSILHWETPWRKTHRLAGVCWMLAGLQLLVFTFVLGTLPWYSFVLALFLLLSEFPAEAYYAKQEG